MQQCMNEVLHVKHHKMKSRLDSSTYSMYKFSHDLLSSRLIGLAL